MYRLTLLAEREGFEPPVGVNPLLFSRQVHSSALPSFRVSRYLRAVGVSQLIVDPRTYFAQPVIGVAPALISMFARRLRVFAGSRI